jgi:hypothetical protein
MSDRNTHVIDLYTRHPISAEQIISKVGASRGHLENLTPEDFYPHDQDHYGGLSANDALAERASIRRDEHRRFLRRAWGTGSVLVTPVRGGSHRHRS